MKINFMDVATSVQSSKMTIRNIKRNLLKAFTYNKIGITLAAGTLIAYGGPKINPMIAGGAMAFSSISVLLNAFRLKRFKPSIY